MMIMKVMVVVVEAMMVVGETAKAVLSARLKMTRCLATEKP